MRTEEELFESSGSETCCFKLIKTACLSFFKVKQGGYSFVVRAKGLEPPRRKAPDPKSGTSTNSATPAKCGANVLIFFISAILHQILFNLFFSECQRLPKFEILSQINAANFLV